VLLDYFLGFHLHVAVEINLKMDVRTNGDFTGECRVTWSATKSRPPMHLTVPGLMRKE